ncbi:hypothetical protein BT63DRAFT_455887 [Microthyrium microscopicum]|uniref:DUF7726 domain-containing protein n=1 Tax=Microthyrium microscopicum TaxID=703497 RepID=A0A6A6U9H6_9PEZI|nr:hypothetical protein BT63DRAFT_455887 [Microthyrium microscopicum]
MDVAQLLNRGESASKANSQAGPPQANPQPGPKAPAVQASSTTTNDTPALINRPPLSNLSTNASTSPPVPQEKPVKSFARSYEEMAGYSIEQDEEDFDEPRRPMPSCNAMRTKIRLYIENGNMKVGEFCKALGVSNKSYNNFLKSSGHSDSATYYQGVQFFWKLDNKQKAEKRAHKEAMSLMPKAKRVKATPGEPSAAAKKNASLSGNTSSQFDIKQVLLPNEAEDRVQVFDTCDEVRRKITLHLKKPGVTQAGFCRDLVNHCVYAHRKPGQFQSVQLTKFRGKKGPHAGATTNLFYAAYVFFEKERVLAGEPKSKARLEMEKIWGPEGGFDLENDGRHGYFCMGSQRPQEDKYGQVTFR